MSSNPFSPVRLHLFGAQPRAAAFLSPVRIRILGWAMMAVQGVQVAFEMHQTEALGPVGLMRMGIVLLGMTLILQTYFRLIPRVSTLGLFSVVVWLAMTVFTFTLYILSGYARLWVASSCFTIIVYFFLQSAGTALRGLLSGSLVSVGVALAIGPPPAPPPLLHGFIFALVIGLGLLFAVNSLDFRVIRQRRYLSLVTHIEQTLAPPLTAMRELMPQVRQAAAQLQDQPELAQTLHRLADAAGHRLTYSRQYIQMQHTNAQLLVMGGAQQKLRAQELVQTVMQRWPYLPDEPDNGFDLVVEADFSFWGARHEWEQALGNLVVNAQEAMRRTQRKLRKGDILVTVQHRGERGSITVHDKGMGIEGRHRSHIFDPFYAGGADHGVGLGLAYCEKVVALSGGEIVFGSEPKTGTHFQLQIPAQRL